MESAVFLDRDNTLIANDADLGESERVRLLSGVPEGLLALRDAGYRLVVVTNQGGVARGAFTEDDVDEVHQRIAALVDDSANAKSLINRFYYCPYHPEAKLDDYRRDHPWRKPHPGMLLQAARDLNIDLARSWMIGDQERDIAAGRAAGCRTILLTDDPTLAGAAKPSAVVRDFAEATQTILDAATRPLPVDRPTAPPPRAHTPTDDARGGGLGRVERAVHELTDVVRSERARRAEFSGLRMAAGLCQLFALLLAVLGVLQLASPDVFRQWMMGAILAQLVTIALLLADLKG